MATTTRLELTALAGFPVVEPGDDLAQLIVACAGRCGFCPRDGDVVVLAQKIVSKAENRFIDLASVTPSPRAEELAIATGKDARLVEAILAESRRIVRAAPNVLIVEHHLGFIMANAGVDQSNVGPPGSATRALLLPEDPDGSAEVLRRALEDCWRKRIGVVVNDSFGRPWRQGTVGVAIGSAGIPVLMDRRGEADLFGRTLNATVIGYADEIAAAASLIMGQAGEARPVVVIRGLEWAPSEAHCDALVRPAALDLFR